VEVAAVTPADRATALRLAASAAAVRRAVVRIHAEGPTFDADPRAALAELLGRAADQVVAASGCTFPLTTTTGRVAGSVDLRGPPKRWRTP
jgi:hypothetical protein